MVNYKHSRAGIDRSHKGPDNLSEKIREML
jgi:hypothetical protein